MSTKPMAEAILACPVAPELRERLAQAYIIHYVPVIKDREKVVSEVGDRVQVVITNGAYGWSGDLMARMPKLRIIAVIGAGYENVDLDGARRHNVQVTYGRGANTSSVADHAVALLLSLVRDVPFADQMVRTRPWGEVRYARPDVTGARLGIVGLGDIGLATARRLAGFDLEISYHNRKPRDDVSYRYIASVDELAAQVDFLVVTAPGGPATYHMINAGVLRKLGEKGYLVNVGRGSVVDSESLAQALSERVIAGAALDIFKGEPVLPDVLRNAPNLIVTPHIAGFSPRSTDGYVRAVIDNVDACLAGKPVPAPVPGSTGT